MKVLVLWYSRSGNTTKVAHEIARALEEAGDVEVEMQELEEVGVNRDGPIGWLKGGGDATRKHSTEIKPVLFDVADFDLVVIGTPVWAFTMAPAARTVCEEHGPSCPKVAFFCTQSGLGDVRTFREMEEACTKEPIATLTIIDRHVVARDPHKLTSQTEAFAQLLITSAAP